MKNNNLPGQLNIFSVFQEDNEFNSEYIPEVVKATAEEEIEPIEKSQADNNLDLEIGDVIWTFSDRKISSDIVIENHGDYCITRTDNGTLKRITARSKGICWASTREAVQKLCDTYYHS